jgi:hypothetical protein
MLSSQISTHKCHFCGKLCRSAGGLGRHLKTHVGEYLPAVQRLHPVPNFIHGSSISASALPSMFAANIAAQHEGDGGAHDGNGSSDLGVEEEKAGEVRYVVGEMETDDCEGNDWTNNRKEVRAHTIPDFEAISHRFLDYGHLGPMARLRNLNARILKASQVLLVFHSRYNRCTPSN